MPNGIVKIYILENDAKWHRQKLYANLLNEKGTGQNDEKDSTIKTR